MSLFLILLLSNTHIVKGTKTIISMPSTLSTSTFRLGFLGSSLWQSWVGRTFTQECPWDWPCGYKEKDAGWGRGRSWAVMQAWQALAKPTGSSSPIRVASKGYNRSVLYPLPWSVIKGCYLEGHDLGQGSFLRLKKFLKGPQPEAVSLLPAVGVASSSFKEDLRSASPFLGCWGRQCRDYPASQILWQFYCHFAVHCCHGRSLRKNLHQVWVS